MSTLYISDLDGTLLNKEKKISERSKRILNDCIREGMKFSIATARMPYGCDYRLKDINLQIPGILTNGVFLYDFNKKQYISAESIEPKCATDVIELLEEHLISCFVYVYYQGGIHIYYGKEELRRQTQYYSDRALEECKEVRLVQNLRETAKNGEVVYITYSGEKSMLEPISEALKRMEGIHHSFYLNIYNGLYCLEIYSSRASKKAALLKLKTYVDCNEVVVFGDNWNDVPMIEIADRSYAPDNAIEEIKQMVTGCIAGCNDDGVARFLREEHERKHKMC
ncbi:HAD-IIB family hydrolase [Eubacterium sp. am_0171]|uniref:HAD-IIB family hydrolase n=1 Tax=unclassified Eubacterium (in: firmicutes) TaxID=2624479 RepID=UPI001021EF2F|nr:MULTISPECIES: HAD-IIB family hydrolase [unclassified Eubacterium (in: firmicutes)]MSC86398.1 HAD-IIB family hydrolase [Eubacterium sp. BIOML-A1]MSD08688.1 HAD-IIB family hydrolase [Eubacterium sp. BIOML-A2]RYT11601.1 HAD-IIB family hydrolase [Eubacterium sp. am_0171]